MPEQRYPYGKPSIEPPDAFWKTRDKLRNADFGDTEYLRDAALPLLKRYSDQLNQSRLIVVDKPDELYYLFALALQAEVLEYLGKYPAVVTLLKIEATTLLGYLKTDDLGYSRTRTLPRAALLRQQLWILIFYAHTFYRTEDLETAESQLKEIRKYTDQHLPISAAEPSYGLRARIAYSLGQVYRQMSNAKDARKEFVNAIELTNKRLEAKHKKYSTSEDAMSRLQEQHYANYIIAKAFAFGLSWASYSSGELARARGASAAGCALLEGTNDKIHKTYAQVIYAEILTAGAQPSRSGAPVSEDLSEALRLLENAADDASCLGAISRLLDRARYARARTLYTAGKFEEAIALADSLYTHESAEQGTRWHLESGFLLVRIMLEHNRNDAALALSQQLRDLSKGMHRESEPMGLRAKALLCHAEAFMASGSSCLQDVRKDLDEAEHLCRNSLLLSSRWKLLCIHCHKLEGNIETAREELREWFSTNKQIEHGDVVYAAKRLDDELDPRTGRLVFDVSDFAEQGGYSEAHLKLKRWSIERLYALFPHRIPSDDECRSYTGREWKALTKWMKEELHFNPWSSQK